MDADDGGGEKRKKQVRELHGGLGLAGPPANIKHKTGRPLRPRARISLCMASIQLSHWHTGIALAMAG